MKLTKRDWLERVKLAGKIYNETHTHNTVAINNFILNSRENTQSFVVYMNRDINAAINIKNQGQLDCYEQLLD